MINLTFDDSIIPFGNQKAFLEDWTHTYISLQGGLRSGKSFSGWVKLYLILIYNYLAANEPIPGLVVCPSHKMLEASSVKTAMEVADLMNLEVAWKRKDQLLILKDLDNCEIYLRTAQNSRDIKGFQVGVFLCDEAGSYRADYAVPQNDAIVQSMGRLAHPRAKLKQGLFVGSPEELIGRWYQMFYIEDNPNRAMYILSTRDNPLMTEYVKMQESVLSDDLIRQYVDGEFYDRRGQFAYEQFSEERNVNPDVELKEGIALDIMMDFGRNPGNVCLAGYQQDGNLYVAHEIHRRELDTRGAMKDLKNLVIKQGGFKRFQNRVNIFGDAMGQWGNSETSESSYTIVRQFLSDWGVDATMKVRRKNPRVHDRTNAFNCVLSDIKGKTRWKCNPRCKGLIKDLKYVKYDSKGKSLIKTPELSHFSDASGYHVEYCRPVQIEQAPTNEDWGRFSVG